MGAKPQYGAEIRQEILTRLAMGETLRQICKLPGMPTNSTVVEWNDKDPVFAEQYARARREGLDVLAEEMLEIADDGTNDYMTRTSENGQNKVLDAEHVNRSRLRIDARKWLLSKLRPDKYGDDQRIQLTGAGGGAVQTKHIIEFPEWPPKQS